MFFQMSLPFYCGYSHFYCGYSHNKIVKQWNSYCFTVCFTIVNYLCILDHTQYHACATVVKLAESIQSEIDIDDQEEHLINLIAH